MGMQMWVPAYKMFHAHSTSKQYIIDKNRNRHCFQTNHMKIWQHKRTNHQTASTIEMMIIPIIQVVAEIFSFRFARFLCAFSTLSVFDLFSLFRVSWYASCLYGWVHDSQRKVQQYNNLQHIKIYIVLYVYRDILCFYLILFYFHFVLQLWITIARPCIPYIHVGKTSKTLYGNYLLISHLFTRFLLTCMALFFALNIFRIRNECHSFFFRLNLLLLFFSSQV